MAAELLFAPEVERDVVKRNRQKSSVLGVVGSRYGMRNSRCGLSGCLELQFAWIEIRGALGNAENLNAHYLVLLVEI